MLHVLHEVTMVNVPRVHPVVVGDSGQSHCSCSGTVHHGVCLAAVQTNRFLLWATVLRGAGTCCPVPPLPPELISFQMSCTSLWYLWSSRHKDVSFLAREIRQLAGHDAKHPHASSGCFPPDPASAMKVANPMCVSPLQHDDALKEPRESMKISSFFLFGNATHYE